MDNKVLEVIRGNFVIATLMYVLESATYKTMTKEEQKIAVDKWSEDATNILLRSLESSGYTIVPKEKSFKEMINPT